MHADSFYRIGASHDVCQDYARHNQRSAVVSDGCSSSPDTDWGARIMCMTELGSEPERTCHSLGYVATERLPHDLQATALDATSLGIHVRGETAYVTMIGDGAVVLLFKDGRFTIRVRHYENNCPFYAHYSTDQRRIESHRKVAPNSTWDVYSGTWDAFTCAQCEVPNDYNEPRAVEDIPIRDLKLALVMTDGVESFVDADKKPVPITTVIECLLDIKSFKGEFMRRRCKAFFGRHCKERGWIHHDDFAVAAYYFGEE